MPSPPITPTRLTFGVDDRLRRVTLHPVPGILERPSFELDAMIDEAFEVRREYEARGYTVHYVWPEEG